jgi:hypothetical protein
VPTNPGVRQPYVRGGLTSGDNTTRTQYEAIFNECKKQPDMLCLQLVGLYKLTDPQLVSAWFHFNPRAYVYAYKVKNRFRSLLSQQMQVVPLHAGAHAAH